MRIKGYIVMAIIVGVIMAPANLWAQGASTNFRIDESSIGPGGNLDSGSASYQIESGQQSVGNTGVGESGSTNYTTQSGDTTTADPRLSCVLNSGSLNFGGLSNSVTVYGTATFSVLNYTSYGYNVTILGNTPSNGLHNLTAMSSTGPSVIGTEQFGINLRDNATPNVGADPVQTPSGSFSYGTATANYNTADNFRYVAGEAIATAPRSSGQTDYTISYIVNTSSNTPGGQYTGSQTILCTGTY